MEASEPLRVAEATERFDVDATITRRRRQRPGRRPAHGPRPLARRARARDPRARSRRPASSPATRGRRRARSTASRRPARRRSSPSADRATRAAAVKFGTDGVRGVANTDLTASFALDLGRAAARVLGGSEAVVGGDTRLSTAMLEAAFVAGLASEGVVVHRLGVVPTPVVAFEAARRDCLGAMISASHNPYQRQRHQAVRPRRHEAARRGRGSASRPTSSPCRRPTGDPAPARRRRGQPGLPRPRPRRARGPPARRAAHRRRRRQRRGQRARRRRCSRATGADVVVIHDRARRPQHQRRLRGHRHRVAGRRGRRRTAPTSGSPSTATPTGCSPSTTPARSSTATTSSPSAPSTCTPRGVLRDDTVVVTVMTNLGFRLAMEAAGIHVVETAVGDRYVLEALDAGGLLARRRAERARHLPRPRHDRRRPAHRRRPVRRRACGRAGRSPTSPRRR